MRVRGAPLIGVTAAYGVCARAAPNRRARTRPSTRPARELLATRPTAVNLRWALDEMRASAEEPLPPGRAHAVAGPTRGPAPLCRRRRRDLPRDRRARARPAREGAAIRRGGSGPLQVLTHCNAGWLATVDWGNGAGARVPRPRRAGCPGARLGRRDPAAQPGRRSLTAWELGQHGVPHTVMADNAGGHLMQEGRVDLLPDRQPIASAANGDVCNKIGTYLKALAARDNGVPFYVALAPQRRSTGTVADGVGRHPDRGARRAASCARVSRPGAEDGEAGWRSEILPRRRARWRTTRFDVTPARLVTALVTERGVCPASTERRSLSSVPREARDGAWSPSPECTLL